MVPYVTFLPLLRAGRIFNGAAFVREAEEMNFLGIFQERISKRLEVPQHQTISGYSQNGNDAIFGKWLFINDLYYSLGC